MQLWLAGWLWFGCAAGQAPPAVEEIMARVAENQARAQEMRSRFVYRQKLLMRFHRGGGKLAREERHEYVVTPTAQGSRKELERFEGRYQRGGRLVPYDQPGFEYKEIDIDGEIMRDFADDLTDDKRSRDGIGRDLFPLTADQQRHYRFALKGRHDYRGREVYVVTFEPHGSEDGGTWAGQALIDAREFQPVLVTSRLALRVPLWVKTVLGTRVKGVGFSLSYQKFDDGIWFPVSYGGEFEIRALFFYKRHMSISLGNSDFQRTDVSSRVAYALDAK
jgi:hypothetical protein